MPTPRGDKRGHAQGRLKKQMTAVAAHVDAAIGSVACDSLDDKMRRRKRAGRLTKTKTSGTCSEAAKKSSAHFTESPGEQSVAHRIRKKKRKRNAGEDVVATTGAEDGTLETKRHRTGVDGESKVKNEEKKEEGQTAMAEKRRGHSGGRRGDRLTDLEHRSDLDLLEAVLSKQLAPGEEESDWDPSELEGDSGASGGKKPWMPKSGKRSGPREEDEFKVFLGGLAWSMRPETVRSDFEECGELRAFEMPRNKDGLFMGIAFVSYASQQGLDRALEYDGTEYYGRTIKVKKSDPTADPKRAGLRAKGVGESKSIGKGRGKGKGKGSE